MFRLRPITDVNSFYFLYSKSIYHRKPDLKFVNKRSRIKSKIGKWYFDHVLDQIAFLSWQEKKKKKDFLWTREKEVGDLTKILKNGAKVVKKQKEGLNCQKSYKKQKKKKKLEKSK